MADSLAARPASEAGASSLRGELLKIARLSAPVVAAQLGYMLMGLVDTLMVARLGITELGATATGNLLFWFILSVGVGLVSGADPLISQAHGAGEGERTGRALQTAIAVAVLASLPLMACLYFTQEWLVLLDQPSDVALWAGDYNCIRMMGVAPYLVFTALRLYLQGRGHMKPSTWVIWFANGINILLNWVFIWGHLGAPAMGLQGAALASLLTTTVAPVLLVAWVVKAKLHDGAWSGWCREALSWLALRQVIQLGVPVGIQMGLEAGAFAVATAMAGHLGVLELGAHQIVMTLTAFVFMIPVGISMAASVRVGNLIGAGDLVAMRRAVHAALLLGSVLGVVSAAGYLLFRNGLPSLFADAAPAAHLAASVLPIVAAFQVVDGIQVISGGVLRGMGRAQATAWVNLVSWVGVGLPAASWLSGAGRYGLAGIWMGLALGLLFCALALGSWALMASPPKSEVFTG